MNELCRTALEWRKLGYPTIPIERGGKRPLVKWSEYSNSVPSIPQLLSWFKSGQNNIAVVCGGSKNLTVVDFDTQTGYYSALSRLGETTRDIMLHTYKVKTGRGIHVFFNVKTPSRKNVEDKIDIKADGGYVLVPPSLHPSGKTYRQFNGATINDITTIDLPTLLDIANIKEAIDEPTHGCEVLDFEKTERDKFDPDDIFTVRNDFDYVLDRISILRVAMMFTPMFQKRGTRYWMGMCPVHKDHDPSFWVDTKLGIAKCYSTACTLNDKAVNAIGLYALCKNISYTDAMRELLDTI